MISKLLFLADTLARKHPIFATSFFKILQQHGIAPQIIPSTNDIWARDYMPIQVSDHKFVQFTYRPDYLLKTKKDLASISNVDLICEQLYIKPIKSHIILDGGNLVRCNNKIILTDKIFRENSNIPRLELITELRELLEADELIFIPQDRADVIGHSDGMVRFINSETVFVNDYSQESPVFRERVYNALRDAGLEYILFPYNPYNNKYKFSAVGVYINYLEINDYIFVPVFEDFAKVVMEADSAANAEAETNAAAKSNAVAKSNTDAAPNTDADPNEGTKAEAEHAIRLLQTTFADRTIVPVPCMELAEQGGVLNCISWERARS